MTAQTEIIIDERMKFDVVERVFRAKASDYKESIDDIRSIVLVNPRTDVFREFDKIEHESDDFVFFNEKFGHYLIFKN